MSGDNRSPNKEPARLLAIIGGVLDGFASIVGSALVGIISICGVVRKGWASCVQWIGKRWGIDAERVLGKLAIRIGLVLIFVLCVAVLYSGVDKSLLFIRTKLNTTGSEDKTDDDGDFDVGLLSAALVGVTFYAFNKQRQKINEQQTEIHAFGQKIQALTDAFDNSCLGPELARFLKPDFVFWLSPTPDDRTEAYRLVTKLKPDDPKAWYNLGVVCKKQGRHDDAIAAFEQAVELKPDYPEVYVIYRKDGKCHKATPAYRRWAELNHPDDSDLWHSLGWSYNIQGKYADAAEAYRRVVELKPNDPNAWFHLGGAYVDQGKCPESLDVLDHLRTLDPALADKLADSLSSTGIRPIEDQQHKKRKVRVLIGNSQPAISEVILDIIAYSGNGQFELVPTTTERAEQVLEYARSQEFDLSIVILNNLSYPPEFNRPAYSSTAHWADEFTDMASQFVAQLKQTCATPIIAMAGEPRDLLLWEKATRAGAANFFLLPFDVGDFQAALKKCLNSANSIRL